MTADIVITLVAFITGVALGFTLHDALKSLRSDSSPTPALPLTQTDDIPYELRDMAIRDKGISMLYGKDAYTWWIMRASDPNPARATMTLTEYAHDVTYNGPYQ
jgi:hypothetical protein